MASLVVHQDVYNFERKRNGLTARQWVCVAVGAVLGIGTTFLLGYAVGIPYTIALTLGVCMAMPALVVGFFPIYNMHAEGYLLRMLELDSRGNALSWRGEDAVLPEGGVSDAYAKARRARGFECR